MEDALVIAMEMTMTLEGGGGMFFYLPYDLLLFILAKLPTRCLVRMKAVGKRWNQMLSSPDAFKLIYRNMPLVRTPAFFIHSRGRGYGKKRELPRSWVIEPTAREVYEVPTHKFPGLLKENIMVNACNGIYCLFHGDTDSSGRRAFTICNPGTNTFKRLPETTISSWDFSALAFDPSTAHFTLLIGQDYHISSSDSSEEDESDPEDCLIEIYCSQCNAWTQITITKSNGIKKIKGKGIYSNGRFYWLIENYSNNKGMILGFSIRERLWTIIQGPQSAYLRNLDLLKTRSVFDYEVTNDHEELSPSDFKRVKRNVKRNSVTWEGETAFEIHEFDDTTSPFLDAWYHTVFPLHAWWLTGNDGRLVLVNKDISCMWELKENLIEWCQVHITLPNPLYGVAVNMGRWTLAAGEKEIRIYNAERILRTTMVYPALNPRFPLEPVNGNINSDYIGPFEWNNVPWP